MPTLTTVIQELDLDAAAAIMAAEHELTGAVATATELRLARDELVVAAVRATGSRTVARSTGLHPSSIRGAVRRMNAGADAGYVQEPLWAD